MVCTVQHRVPVGCCICVPKSALSRDRPFPSLRFSVFLSMIVFHLIKFFSPLSFLFVLLVLD